MIELKNYQNKIVKLIEDNYENYQNFLIEAPTGSGKSIISTYLAKKLFKDKKKKIIISTSTNQLAIELLTTIKQNFKGLSKIKPNIDIVVGKENYLDIENLNLSIFNDFINNPIKVINKINELLKINKNESILLDILLDELDLDEESKEILKNILSTDSNKSYIKDFEDIDISITNHFYLLNKIYYDKNFNSKEYIIILDEVHQLEEVALNIFSDSFSLYRANYLIKKIINEIKFLEFRGQKTLFQNFLKVSNIIEILFKTYTNQRYTGNYFINNEKQINIIKKIIKALKKDEINKLVVRLNNKMHYFPLNLRKLVKLFIKEYEKFKNIEKANLKEIIIYYSPARGYPRLISTKGNIYPFLKGFWEKSQKIIGLSATLFIPDSPNYIYTKLALNEEDTYSYSLPPVFKKEQIKFQIIDKNFPQPKNTEDYVDIEWVKAIGNFIKKTFNNKNSMVLTGSFIEVDEIFEYIKRELPDTNIIKAERDKSTYNIVEKFKKEGGILIATRNYGTGIDLKEELVEKLYIAKLPFPIISNKKWLEKRKYDKLRNTNYSYFEMTKEMLLNLKQWIGRLIRTPEDKGELYILDSRANKYKSKIIKIIDSMFY